MPLQQASLPKWMAICWTVLIFILLVLPSGNLPKTGLLGMPHLDKAAHAVFFALFVILWYHALSKEGQASTNKSLALGLAQVSAVYGINMEFVQVLFTDRAFERLDVVADVVGAVAGYQWVVREKNRPLWT